VIKRTESVRKEKCVADEWQFIDGYNVGGTKRKRKNVIEEEGRPVRQGDFRNDRCRDTYNSQWN
jgi:hypothetical protein